MRGIILSVVIALLVVVGQPVGASIVIPPGDTVPCDFVTGGGFIVGSGTSSLAAGVKVRKTPSAPAELMREILRAR